MSNVVRFARKSVPCPAADSRSMIRKAQSVWRGNAGTDGGALCVESSLMGSLASGNASNPAELLAAAHASCFTTHLASTLQAVGFTPTELSTEAVVTLEPDGASMRISRSALTLRAKIPNLNKATFETIAWHAEQTCPVSKALRTSITLDAKLI
jgi:lipoyl-dependent peroxiredoxin